MENNIENDIILKELEKNRKKFRVDHFDIILSEYVSKYEKEEIILNPPYQRIFRWSIEDQSALIESILLGIPLPPIFALQRPDGKWEIIDGLQRTQTILNFFDEEKEFKLQDLKILTELNNKKTKHLPKEIILRIKNSRIRIELVEETEDIFSQYLLFNRLNSNGEKLSEQEKRNFLIYKKNNFFYEKIQILGNEDSFLKVLGWNEKEHDERIRKQENIEYVIKYFLARFTSKKENKKSHNTIEEFINDEIIAFLDSTTREILEKEFSLFKKTFEFLNNNFGLNALKKNGKRANNISNRFTVITGVSFLIEENIEDAQLIGRLIHDFFESKEYLRLTKNGYSPTKRIYELNRYSYLFFKAGLENEQRNLSK